MKAAIAILKDIRLLLPLGFLILLEIVLQSGLYSYVQKPRSTAKNVRNIVESVRRAPNRARLLILGTSVAFQGINPRLLTRELAPIGLPVQNAACESAGLPVQHMIYRSVKGAIRPRVVIHVADSIFPWIPRETVDPPNLAMLSQFPRSSVFELAEKYDLRLTWEQKKFLWIGLVANRRDLRDMILHPLARFRQLWKQRRKMRADYYHVNNLNYRLSVYGGKNPQQCISRARAPGGTYRIDGKGNIYNSAKERVSDAHHRRTVAHTCGLGLNNPVRRPGAPAWNGVFFKRLREFYGEIRRDGAKLILVFPPYHPVIAPLNEDRVIDVWKKNLTTFGAARPDRVLDMRNSLGAGDHTPLYYDPLHLNRDGAFRFTRELARRVREIAAEDTSTRR